MCVCVCEYAFICVRRGVRSGGYWGRGWGGGIVVAEILWYTFVENMFGKV